MQIGCHVSVAQGHQAAIDYALEVGAECMQFFAKSPRQWRASAPDPVAAAALGDARQRAGFGAAFTHTAYLINLSTTDEELREKSVAALADELDRAALLGVEGVVTHIGNDPGRDWERAAVRAAVSIGSAFAAMSQDSSRVRLLLENTAGAGTSFGCCFEHIGRCIAATGMPAARLGMCLDTCHAYAYGYDVASAGGWTEVVGKLSEHVGVDRLAVIHANDCLFERGSKRDRHAWIGDGLIGNEGFEQMIAQAALAQVAVITEMPGEKPEKDRENVARLKEMRDRTVG